MSESISFVLPLFYGGIGNLAAYLAAHVLLCLLPAFFIAGAMAALIPTASWCLPAVSRLPQPLPNGFRRRLELRGQDDGPRALQAWLARI